MFPNVKRRSHGEPAYVQRVRDDLKALLRSAGIDGSWTPRESRRTFASLISDSGQPVERISDAMGHANSRITQTVYRHQLSGTVAEVAQIMDDIFPAADGK